MLSKWNYYCQRLHLLFAIPLFLIAKVELKWRHWSLSSPPLRVLLLFSIYSNYTAFTFLHGTIPSLLYSLQSYTSWASGKQVCTLSCRQESGRSGLFLFHPTAISRIFILCQALQRHKCAWDTESWGENLLWLESSHCPIFSSRNLVSGVVQVGIRWRSETFQAGHFPQMFTAFPVFIFSPRVCAWSSHWVLFCDGEKCVTVFPATCSELMGKNQLIRSAKLHSAKIKEKTINSKKLRSLERCLLERRAGTKSAD